MERGGTATRRDAITGLGAAAGALAITPLRAAPPPPCALRVPLDAIAHRILAELPDAGVRAGVPAAMDGGPLAHRIDDRSPAGETRLRDALRTARADLAALACAGDADGVLDLAVARAVVENALRSADVPYGRIDMFGVTGHAPYLLSQIGGPAIDVPAAMRDRQSLSTPNAVEAWIARLDAFPDAFANVGTRLAADEAAGCRPPRVLLEGARDAIAGFADGPADRHPLIAALRHGMASAGLDAAFRARANARAVRLLETRARPAFARLGEQVSAMIPRGRGDEAAGVWAQPLGETLYAGNARSLGETALPPAEIHRVGLAEVARLAARLDRGLAARGMTRGDVGARMAALLRDPANLFPPGEEGRAALLDEARRRIAAIEARYQAILPPALIPRQPLEVRRVPAEREAGAPAGFYDGASPDGARAGILWLNLADMGALPRFRLPTVAAHEGAPGHHMQASVALMQAERPLIARIAGFNAFQEGWALYAEQFAAELGAYDRDPLADLGRSQDELFRAARLVVDTGLHHHRWNRARAIAWLIGATGIAPARAAAEVHRIMAWPGQALGYTLGKMRLLELRARMRARLGRRFTPQMFHAAILSRGPMPLDLLAARIG